MPWKYLRSFLAENQFEYACKGLKWHVPEEYKFTVELWLIYKYYDIEVAGFSPPKSQEFARKKNIIESEEKPAVDQTPFLGAQ